jgi:hypothetical protein
MSGGAKRSREKMGRPAALCKAGAGFYERRAGVDLGAFLLRAIEVRARARPLEIRVVVSALALALAAGLGVLEAGETRESSRGPSLRRA